MRRETKIGLLALATIAIIVVGFNFLKGREIFSSTNTYYVIYENVDQLGIGDAVTINGYRVGQVVSIKLEPENVRSLTVGMRLEDDLPIPKNAGALIKSDGILGGKFISLVFAEACSGENCAEDGDFLVAATESMLASLIGDPAQFKEYSKAASQAIGPVIDSITAHLDTNAFGQTLRNVESSTESLASLTARIDLLLSRTSNDLSKTTKSVASIMQNLENNNARIESILKNVDSTTTSLSKVDLAGTLAEVNQTLSDLRQTLAQSGGAIDNLNGITSSINNGEGSMGQLIKSDETAERLNRTLANLDLLLQDFRLNPKRYVNVSVFGKKDKDYVLPEDDPATPVQPNPEGN